MCGTKRAFENRLVHAGRAGKTDAIKRTNNEHLTDFVVCRLPSRPACFRASGQTM
jgi:hypothetical protein